MIPNKSKILNIQATDKVLNQIANLLKFNFYFYNLSLKT